MLSDIDLTLKPQKINIFLCKPNKQIVAKLTEAYNVNLILKLGNLNELTFDLPYEIDLHHELHRNEYIDELRERYLLKVIYNEYHEEFFIINEISELGNDARECKNIHAFSLGYELADKQLKNYKCTPSNASQVLADALSKTIWSVGYIDAAFDLKYRSFEVSTKTILDFVWEIAETFQALILWDTANRKINFYQPEAIGHNRGLKIKYGKYLNSLDKKIYTDEMVTRLIVLGKDGLSIQRINPTGTNYLEDFSYFMYPYEEDQNGNTVTSSYYMSDELCHAIINYKQLIESKRDTFENLISQRSAHEETLTSLNKELADLQAELNKILDDIDIAQALGKDISTYKPDGYTVFLEEARNNKQADVAAQQTEIADAESSLNIVDNQVSDLRNVLSAENNFTPEQLQERNQFIIEKEWSDENYTADEELYKDALKVFADLRTPQTVIEIDIVNFLEILEEQRNWDKLKLGDIITVQYEKLNIDIQAKISEVVFDCENSTVKITITNVKDLKTNEDRLLNMLYQSASTSTTVDMNKFKWNDTVDSMNSVTQLLNGVWDSTKRSINAGVNESVTIDRRGITVTDPSDPLKFLRATHGVVGLTSDGGNNYKVAMDGSGVYAQRLVGNLIAGNDLKIITNSNGSFSVDGKGVTIKGASLTITEGLPESQINSTSVGKWNSAEANAKNYVNQQITEVNTSISQLENDVNNMLSDSKITAIEANSLKTSLNQVVAESTDLINVAGSLGITTEKTNYSNAINDLNSYLTGNWIDQANYPKTITSSQRNTIQNKFKTVQNVKSILINKITAIREQNAKNYAVGKGVTYNGVKIDTANGLTVTRSDNKVKTTLNATSGIKIQTKNDTSWVDKFYADTEGNLTVKGKIDCDELLIDNTNVLEFIKRSEEDPGKWTITADRIGNWPDGSYITSWNGELQIRAKRSLMLNSDSNIIYLEGYDTYITSNHGEFSLNTDDFCVYSNNFKVDTYGYYNFNDRVVYNHQGLHLGGGYSTYIEGTTEMTGRVDVNGDLYANNNFHIKGKIFSEGSGFNLDTSNFNVDTSNFSIGDYNNKIYSSYDNIHIKCDEIHLDSSRGVTINDATKINGETNITGDTNITGEVFIDGKAYIGDRWYAERIATMKWVSDNFVAK